MDAHPRQLRLRCTSSGGRACTGSGTEITRVRDYTPGPPVCDPWLAICEPGPVPPEEIVGSRSSTNFGFNLGAGVDIPIRGRVAAFIEIRWRFVWGDTYGASRRRRAPGQRQLLPGDVSASDSEERGGRQMTHKIEPASSARAKCRGCGEKIAAGELRFGEVLKNPFADGDMTQWFHLECAAFKRPEPMLETLEAPGEPLSGQEGLVAEARAGHRAPSPAADRRGRPRADGPRPVSLVPHPDRQGRLAHRPRLLRGGPLRAGRVRPRGVRAGRTSRRPTSCRASAGSPPTSGRKTWPISRPSSRGPGLPGPDRACRATVAVPGGDVRHGLGHGTARRVATASGHRARVSPRPHAGHARAVRAVRRGRAARPRRRGGATRPSTLPTSRSSA